MNKSISPNSMFLMKCCTKPSERDCASYNVMTVHVCLRTNYKRRNSGHKGVCDYAMNACEINENKKLATCTLLQEYCALNNNKL